MAQTLTTPEPITTSPHNRVPPGPRGNFFLGSYHSLRHRPLQFLLDVARDYGDVTRIRYIIWPIYLINHPDDIKYVLQENNRNYNKDVLDYRLLRWIAGNGLLVNDGESWLHQRRLMQPAFHRKRIEALGTLMTSATLAMLDRWDALAARGEALDVAQEMMGLTLGIVGKALFGTDLSAEVEQIGRAFTIVNEFLMRVFYQPLILTPGLPVPGKRAFRVAQRTLERIVMQIIQQRRQHPEDKGDLLSMLLAVRDEETGEGMDDRQLGAEVLTLLLAGHETTALTLAWTWYLLAEHPEAERKLHEELARVLGGRAPTVDDLPKLAYTRMVIEETLRLYPTGWSFSRNTLADDEIGGYSIPRRSMVLISPYTVHRHPAFWERPEAFEPERFMPERAAGRPRFAYFPFGGGPRQCIGNVFAMTEAQLILATIAQRYRLRVVPGHPVEPEPLITLRLKHGLKVTLER
jgi:cytochrome P450